MISGGRRRPGHPKRLSDAELDLERHGGRTTEGLYARVAPRLLAMAVCVWHNWTTGAPVRRSLIPYDH